MKRERVVQIVFEAPDFGGGMVCVAKLPVQRRDIATGELRDILIVEMTRQLACAPHGRWETIQDKGFVGILPEHPMLHRGCYPEVEADPIDRN